MRRGVVPTKSGSSTARSTRCGRTSTPSSTATLRPPRPSPSTNSPYTATPPTPAFPGEAPPIFDIRDAAGPTNLLVETPALGKAIAQTLGKANIVLMRGHGDTVVGPNVRLATFWAI